MVKSPKLPSLSIFMPAFNEEGNIATTLIDATRAAKVVTDDYEIIVVNDGSRDNTAEIVRELSRSDSHLRLINHSVNQGYGGAVKTGLAKCRKEWIFFTDSDGQFHYDELGKFVAATSNYDLVMGYRKKRMDPFHRVFVAQVLLKVWNFVLFGLAVRDVDCAYKLFRKEVRDAVTLKTESAITVSELIIKTKAAGFRIKQLPVHHYPRRFGEQTGGNWRVIVRAARESFRLYKELHS
jgi:glycosyltransferase involved in cell wall biosynthesis